MSIPRLKRLLRFSALLLVPLAIGGLIKNPVLRVAAVREIRARTGLKVELGRVSSGWFSPAITFNDLRLYNPAEFGGASFIEIPELRVELGLVQLLRRRLHVTFMRFHVNEISLVRNQAGQTNLLSFLARLQPPAPNGSEKPRRKGFQFESIDVLDFTLDKARYVDLRDARNNRVEEVLVRNERFRNVKSKNDLHGIAFIIWLRSGGRVSLGPAAFAAGPPTNLNRDHQPLYGE